MATIDIASCSHYAWIESSRVMVENLAQAVSGEAHGRVHTPVDSKGLIAMLSGSIYSIIHTHGSPVGLFDQRADDRQVNLCSLASVKRFPEFPNLLLVIITACQAAGGDNDDNIAAALSTRISKKGLVIANRHVTWGACHDFGTQNGERGWVAYQNGRLVLTENDFPAFITMADAYQIYRQYVRA